jgi:hypothetical protein
MLILLFGMENRTYFNYNIPGNAPGVFIQFYTGCDTRVSNPGRRTLEKYY